MNETGDLQPSEASEMTRRVQSALRRIGWGMLVFWLIMYALFQVVDILDRAREPNDFKHIYLGAVLLRYGENPYDVATFARWQKQYGFDSINPYVYPPTAGVVLRPLAWLRYGHPDEKMPNARGVWFILNHVMLFGALAICVHLLFGWQDPWPIALTVLLATISYPLTRTYTSGQLNCLLLLIYAGILFGVVRQKDWLAGFLTALGILVKLMPGIFALYFLIKRQWRALIWTGVGFAVLLGISIAAAGWKVHAEYIPVMRQMSYGRSVWEDVLIKNGVQPFYRDPFNQSFNSFFHHVLAPDPLAGLGKVIHEKGLIGVILPDGSPKILVQPWVTIEPAKKANGLANALTVVFAILALFLAMSAVSPWKRRHKNEYKDLKNLQKPLEVSLMIALSLLIPSILWDHYLILLFIPQLTLIAAYLQTARTPYVRIGLLFLATVIMLQPMAFHHPNFTNGLGLLLRSAKLFGALIVFGLLVFELRRGQMAETRAKSD